MMLGLVAGHARSLGKIDGESFWKVSYKWIVLCPIVQQEMSFLSRKINCLSVRMTEYSPGRARISTAELFLTLSLQLLRDYEARKPWNASHYAAPTWESILQNGGVGLPVSNLKADGEMLWCQDSADIECIFRLYHFSWKLPHAIQRTSEDS